MLINDNAYMNTLAGIKAAIREAQYRAVLGANREQILLYWKLAG